MSPAWLPQPAAPLLALGEEFAIPPTTWPEHEDLDLLIYRDERLASDRVRNLTLATVKSLTGAYGDALTCHFMLGDMPLLALSSATDQAALDQFRTDLGASPTVHLELRIDKSRLFESWFGSAPRCQTFLYFFSAVFGELLTNRLERIEELLWKSNTTGKTIVIIPGRDIRLDGKLLAVVGGKYTAYWRKVLPEAAPDTDASQEMYQACRKHLKWQEQFVKRMTPLHLQASGDSLPSDTIANALAAQRLNLVLLYTADRTATDNRGQMIATFEGAGQTVKVPFLDPTELLSEESIRSGAGLQPLIEWIYEPHWVADRLALTQLGLAQSLGAIDDCERAKKLLAETDNTLGNLQWHWKAFIDNKLDAYDAQVRALADYVGDTVKSFAEQIGEMIKGLSDTMLAAIAAVLGSFVAAVFGDKFNPTVFAIGVICYAAYVAAFPLAYNMSNQWERYKLLLEQFQQRRKRFEEVLPTEKVKDTIAGHVASSEDRFKRWFWLTIVAYLVVIALSLASAWIVPSVMKGIPVATPTVTPSASPIGTPAP